MSVSVIIPTYNRGYIIGDAMNGVLRQSYSNLEIVIVDDGSSDDTREVVRGFGQQNIRYIRHDRNRGCSAAYNTGIAAATAPLIAFLDSDDVWKPNYLELQIACLSQFPQVDLVFTDTEILDGSIHRPSLMGMMPAFARLLRTRPKSANHVFSRREMYLCLLEEVPIKPSACVMKRRLLDQTSAFDEAWPSGTDWDLFLRLSRIARFGYIDRPLVVQHRTSDATHQKFLEQDKIFLLNVLMKEKAELREDSEALRAVNRGIAGLANSLGWAYLEHNQAREALRTYSQGFKTTLSFMLLTKIVTGLGRILGRRLTKAAGNTNVSGRREGISLPEHHLR
jgi:glycosyltransferase involved in cell wall biosynthesis